MGAILQMPFSVEAHITPLSSSSREYTSLLGNPSVTVSLYNLVLSQTLIPSSVANHSSPRVSFNIPKYLMFCSKSGLSVPGIYKLSRLVL